MMNRILKVRPDWSEWPQCCDVPAAVELACWHVGRCDLDRRALALALGTKVPMGMDNPLGLPHAHEGAHGGTDIVSARARYADAVSKTGCPVGLRVSARLTAPPDWPALAATATTVSAVRVAELPSVQSTFVIIERVNGDEALLVDPLAVCASPRFVRVDHLTRAALRTRGPIWSFSLLAADTIVKWQFADERVE